MEVKHRSERKWSSPEGEERKKPDLSRIRGHLRWSEREKNPNVRNRITTDENRGQMHGWERETVLTSHGVTDLDDQAPGDRGRSGEEDGEREVEE
jgi:hypothetical protein